MIRFPNCKINIGLNIVSKRQDGYHNLETVFYPIGIKDILEIVRANETAFHCTGLTVTGSNKDNLCVKAYELLKKEFPQLPAVHIHLHKVIPMGAGLGGGSSNGAFVLSMLNDKFGLQLNDAQLQEYALQLGSDCPFFIVNKPSFATGRGENLSAVAVDLSQYTIVLVNPGIHVSTKEAFSLLQPQQPVKPIFNIVQQPVYTWKDELVNDFEKTVLQLHPPIRQIKQSLYNSGAVYAAMTGTGSTVYGIFANKVNDLAQIFPPNYTCFILPASVHG